MLGRIVNSRPLTVLFVVAVTMLAASSTPLFASEADLAIPDLHEGKFNLFGTTISAWNLLFYGALVICGTLGISLYLKAQIRKLPAHKSMLDVADIIYATCKTYLLQQGKFLLMLFVLIACAISYYLLAFGGEHAYQLTDRTLQELRLYPDDDNEIPAAVLSDLAPMQDESYASREAYLSAIEARIGSAEWDDHGETITQIAAPVPIDPILKVVLVLLFSVVGMGGSYWVAWYGI